MLVHDTAPTGFWKLARISKLISGTDGRVRGAVLKVASPDKKTHAHSEAPTSALYLLELPDHSTSSDKRIEESVNEPEPETKSADGAVEVEAVEQAGQPKRSAAKKARDYARAVAILEGDSDQD